MDDIQPNERRLSRKGAPHIIPRVRTTRPYPSPTWQQHKRDLILHLPPECRKSAHGYHNARKTWIEEQKYHLQTDRHLSVLSFRYLDHDNSVLFTCRTEQAPRSSHSKSHESYGRLNTTPDSVPHHTIHPRSDRAASCFGQSEIISLASSRMELAPRMPPSSRDSCPAHQSSSVEEPAELSKTKAKSSLSRFMPIKPVTRHRTAIPVQKSIPVPGGQPSSQAVYSSPFPPSVAIPQVRQVHGRQLQYRSKTRLLFLLAESVPQASVQTTQLQWDHQLQSGMKIRLSGPLHPLVALPFMHSLPLPLGPHDKPRRILRDHDYIYVVTAHGIIDQVQAGELLKLDHNVRLPPVPYQELLDDACILSHQGDPVIVLGHAREQDQLALLSMQRGRVFRHVTLHRGGITTKRPGVSAVTPLMSPLKFASGGYDHRIHLWNISHDLSGASSAELAIRHTSLIHCLLPIVDTSHKLVSVGADRDIHLYDLSAERVSQTLKTSCTPYHAHSTDSRSCILLEVAHLETQFEIRDHRMVSQAAQRFGFLTEERRGRYEKADSWSNFVACGDKNGMVHLWDLRNLSQEITLLPCFGDTVIQVVRADSCLLACSKRNELACINL